MSVYRTAPTYELPLTVGDKTHAAWYRFFQNTDLGVPPSSETPISVGASPFIYATKQKGTVLISGGTVSNIGYSRSGTFYSTGQTSGAIAMSANDQIKVTFSVAPSMVFMPA